MGEMTEFRSDTYDEKLERILQAAASVFAEKGYHRASIRDLSRATGVSLSGLYYYVASKEDLLFQIQEHCFGTVLENLEQRLRGTNEPVRRLQVFIENHLRYFAANRCEMKVISHEAASLGAEYRERVNALKRRYTEICTGILRALAPPGGAPDLRVATYSLFGMMNWIYNWYDPQGDVGVDQLADTMSRLFLHGFLADGALALPVAQAEAYTPPSIWRR
ncbi:MAG: TetR/AcrR family transcriptional regulator [Longimicrobiales bacterium]